ncbi:MAG TPA: Ku protein [Steroidobacteraceae bacterium]|nr:Ku protein [Steroidobacteraceae bacterium]
MASRRKKKSNGHAHDGADGDGSGSRKKKSGRSRGLWNGAISFSLIHIPVSLHTAARSSTLDLDLLDKRDFAPVGYQRYNKSTGKTVNWDDVVKGYEYEKGEYVVLTDEDFRRANVEASRTIDIQTFVHREAIAPYYFDTPYFLVPDKGGERVYALLRAALEQSKKLAVATFVLRSRQHVAALMPVDKAIVLNTLRFEDEIQQVPDTAGAAKKAATGRELEMALKLIDEMTETWHPEQFQDTYRNDLMKRIQQKVKSGQTHALTEPEAEAGEERAAGGGKVVDLMSLLERSLAQRSDGGGTSSRASKRKHSAARRRTSNVRAARRA